jgi:TM2 domain-containing membrane protein YozV
MTTLVTGYDVTTNTIIILLFFTIIPLDQALISNMIFLF